MKKLNVFCLWVGSKYSIEYVIKLRNMLQRHLTIPYEFICLTDKPYLHRDIEGVKFDKAFITIVDSWCKLSLFVPNMENLGYTGKSLFLDLDVVIVSNIDKLVTENDDFTIIKDWRRPTYNSSVMIFEIGKRNKLYMNFSKSCITKYNGDQDHITEELKGDGTVKTFNPNFIQSYKFSNLEKNLKKFTKIVIFHGKPKPHECDGWVKEHWV